MHVSSFRRLHSTSCEFISTSPVSEIIVRSPWGQWIKLTWFACLSLNRTQLPFDALSKLKLLFCTVCRSLPLYALCLVYMCSHVSVWVCIRENVTKSSYSRTLIYLICEWPICPLLLSNVPYQFLSFVFVLFALPHLVHSPVFFCTIVPPSNFAELFNG